MKKNEVVEICKIILSGICLILFGVVTWWLTSLILTSSEKPYKEPKRINLPTTEDVGEFTGKQSKNFAKGFIKGIFKKD
jgi:hypothetical protein